MKRRTGLAEDLMSIASRMSWQAGVLAAVLSWAALHLATLLLDSSQAPTVVGEIGVYAARSLLGTMARLLQYIVPACLLVGAVASRLRRSHARGLFERAHGGSEDAIRRMTWSEFEQLIGEAFRRRGYTVTESAGRGPDGGIDLQLSKEDEQVLVQCKHWRARSVGVKVVRELYGIMAARSASGGYVVTSGAFTHEAWAFAQACNIELIDRDGLASLIREAERSHADGLTSDNRDTVNRTARIPDSAEPPCPQCGSAMAQRTARRGPHAGKAFWGCSRYPICRGMRPMHEAVARVS